MENLSSIVGISSRFQRSVNISSDLLHAPDNLQGYQLHQSSVRTLQVISDHLTSTSQRAFTITGPYGSGKSSLGLFLCSLMGPNSESKDLSISKLDQFPESPALKKAFCSKSHEIRVISGKKGDIQKDLNEALFGDSLLSFTENLASHPNGLFKPTLVVIDEMGRYLQGDQIENCSSLQEFAEYLNRGNKNILFVGILHQTLSAYSNSTSQAERDEWAKVQGRFVDVPLVVHPEETLKILSDAIEHRGQKKGNRTLSDKAVEITTDYLSNKKHIDKTSYSRSFKESWPLNPVTSVLLGPMARRGFWQNNRSIFNFLTSQEPGSFNDFLISTEISSGKLYSPANLWDYLFLNYDQSILSDISDSHKWLLTKDAVERAEALGSAIHVELAKTIGLISMFKAGSGIEASLKIIEASLPHYGKSQLTGALGDLAKWKIIIERRHLNAFALFEGSDFDFETAIKELKISEVDPVAVNKIVKFPSLVARRYYAETGNLRWFTVEVVNQSTLKEEIAKDSEGATGKFLLWLDEMPLDLGSEEERERKLLIFGIPTNQKAIRDLAIEVQQLSLLAQDPLLEGDKTARKEVELRQELATSNLKAEVDKAFLNITWLVPGKLDSNRADDIRHITEGFRELSSFASELCEKRYSTGLLLKNELINRQSISSNIRSAQKKLLLAMIQNEGKQNLGIEGFPPEAMIYFSLFKQKSLHVKNKDGTYKFQIPTGSDIQKIWKATEKKLIQEKSINLEKLFAYWDNPPFGIKNGIKPILALFYFLTHLEVLSIYRDGIYQPVADANLVEMLASRPDTIELKYQRFEGVDSDLTKRLFEVLKQFDATLIHSDSLSIARSLVKIVMAFPKWTLRTNRASETSRKFREAVISAWDPLKLLYEQLPSIFGEQSSEGIAKKTLRCIEELSGLNPQMLNEIQDHFLRSLDADGELEKLRARATSIKGISGQLSLDAFINRAASYSGSIADNEGLLGLATSKRVGEWTDLDIVKAKVQLAEWAFSFRHLEALSLVQDKKPNRKLFGLVLAGEKGQNNIVIDSPSTLPPKAQEVQARMQELLSSLPRDQAISVLIEGGLELLHNQQNG